MSVYILSYLSDVTENKKTQAHFRGLFVPKHHSLDKAKSKVPESSFESPLGIQTNFSFELIWSEETYDSPVQVKKIKIN